MRRRVSQSIARVVVAGLFLAVLGGTAHAQDEGGTGIRITGGSAEITVATGVTAGDIVVGRSSPARGPVYRCSLIDGGHGDWHLIVLDWSSLMLDQQYYQVCQPTSPGPPPILRFITWDPADPDGGLGVTGPEIRQWITDNGLLTPQPIPAALSPAGEQITGLETWIWPDGPDRLAPVYASAGGLTVGVRARLDAVTFDVGEPGVARFTCRSFSEWTDGASNPACSHTYLTEPDSGSYRLFTQALWTFEWDDNGLGWADYGIAEPFQTQDVVVMDLEAVISRRGG